MWARPTEPVRVPSSQRGKPCGGHAQGRHDSIRISAGLTFENAGSQWSRSWWRWIADALTPFGWVLHATPQFIRKKTRGKGSEHFLAYVGLMPSCGGSPEENHRVAEEWLVHELGALHQAGDRDLLRWRYEWGSDELYYEIRDGFAEVVVWWEPFSSELDAEIKEQLRSLGYRPEASQ
jgi:hypothetical protein